MPAILLKLPLQMWWICFTICQLVSNKILQIVELSPRFVRIYPIMYERKLMY